MKTLIALAGLSLAVVASFAATKPCDELKSEIAAKLDAQGAKNYQLDIVANDDVKGQTVVGSCEGGTKKITCSRGDAATADAPPEKAAPSGRPSPASSAK